MAFVRTQTWEEFQQPAMPLPALPPAAQRSARRTGALVFTALVHALLLWVLATRLVPAPQDAGGTQRTAPAPGLLSFDLAESQSAVSEATEAVQPPMPASLPTAEVDATVQTELAPEWSVARIRLAEPPPPSAAPAPAPAPVLASGPPGQGADGGVYDPYAGAAPLRLTPEAPQALAGPVSARIASGEFAAHFQLDEAALAVAARRLAGRFPGWDGTAPGMRLTVSPAGFVISAETSVRGGAEEAERELAATLVGLKLFQVVRPPVRPLSTQLTHIRLGRPGQFAGGS